METIGCEQTGQGSSEAGWIADAPLAPTSWTARSKPSRVLCRTSQTPRAIRATRPDPVSARSVGWRVTGDS